MIENGHPKERQGLSITEYMHQHGVNIRHVGLLRYYLRKQNTNQEGDAMTSGAPLGEETINDGIGNRRLEAQALSSEMLQECLGRTLKNLLRDLMRMWMCSRRTASEDGMVQLVVRFLNLITGHHSKASHFWRTMLIPGVSSRWVLNFIHCVVGLIGA